MIDLVKLAFKAGSGGHGRVAFRREKYIPKGGPHGGQGGNGGSIILRASTHKNTLGHLAGVREISAEPGQPGGKKQLTGRAGEDTVVEVPVGTIVWQIAENQAAKRRELPDGSLRSRLRRGEARFETYELEKETERIPARDSDEIEADIDFSLKNIHLDEIEKTQLIVLTEPGQELLLCQGGFGGRGNELFKSPSRTTPLIAEYGTPGEQRLILLELQLLADVGLVGLPNAGKSTFLGRVTKANPRVASYPFTTLEPQLGVWAAPLKKSRKANTSTTDEIIVADIPGLIEGASKGLGLGFTFLRHIKACQSLLFFLAPDEEAFGKLQEGATEPEELIRGLEIQLQVLLDELEQFDSALLEKKRIICLNKIDLLPSDVLAGIRGQLAKIHPDWQLISGVSGEGLQNLHDSIAMNL